ncbi:hypothetical protein J7K74_03670 [Candidatus Woesearchaeota archaeon]|nr:hypothetical protein [Candidatus Woesearchaeota archaeon]
MNKTKILIIFIGIILLSIIGIGIVRSATTIECAVINGEEYCCNEEDNVCAWLFGANCSSTPDPDCYVKINGTVYYDNYPMPNITVEALPITSEVEERSTLSNAVGHYELKIDLPDDTYISDYLIVAHGPGLDSRAERFPYYFYPPLTISHNFDLRNSTCSPDCTDYRGLCSYDCLGYTTETGSCQPVNEEILKVCENKPKGMYAYWKTIGNEKIFVKCCEGKENLTIPILRENLTGSVKHLVKHEITAKLGDIPVRLVILTWE